MYALLFYGVVYCLMTIILLFFIQIFGLDNQDHMEAYKGLGISYPWLSVSFVIVLVSRYTGTEAAGNRIFLEIYSVVGTTPTTVTASYTNENGVSGRTTQAVTFGGSGKREVGRMIYLPFQAGDFGARSVQSVTVLATTGTAGDFGVTIVRPITPMLSSSIMFTQEYLTQLPPTKELKSDACLFLMANLIVTSSGPNIYAMLSMIEVAD
jgi:hypothetical protein